MAARMSSAELKVLLRLDDRASKQIRTAMGGIETQAKKATSSMSRMGAGFAKHWKMAAGAIGAVVIAGYALQRVVRVIQDIVGASIEFESAFAGVRKTVNATDKEFQILSQDLLKMSTEIPVAATELARIQEISGQLGVTGVENLRKFTKNIALISVTTDLTAERAAKSFARIANIMQEPLKNIDRMGSAVVELGNTSATSEPEILEFAERIAGAGKVAGLSTEDLFAFGAAFSSVGVKAERGGTAVSKALLMMGSAVTNGGAELQKFADIAGMTSAEFVQAYEKDAGKAFALFIEGLGKAGLKGTEMLDELGLADQRLIQAFLSVGGATGILTEKLIESAEATAKNTALVEEAEKRFETTESKIIILKNTVDKLKIAIGDELSPAVVTLTEELTALTKTTTDLIEQGNPFESWIDIVEMELILGALSNFRDLMQEVFDIGVAMGEELGSGQSPEEAAYNQALASGGEAMDDYPTGGAEKPEGGKEGAGGGQGEAQLNSMKKALADFKKEYDKITQSMPTLAESSAKLIQKQITVLSKGIGDAFAGMIVYGKNFGESMKQGFQQMLASFISAVVQMIAQWVIMQAVGWVLQAAALATVATMATAMTAMWTVPAALASIATLGGAAAIGSAAVIASIVGLKLAASGMGAVPMAEGGIVTSPTLALIGEAGAEAVIPLDRGGGGVGGVNVYIDNANFNDEDDVSDVFEEINTMLEENRRSAI